MRDSATLHRLLQYDAPPEYLVEFFRSLPKTADEPKIIPFDEILEEELFK